MNNDQERYRSHCAPGSTFVNKMTDLDNGISLNSVKFNPCSDRGFPPVVFFPGFASIIENFSETIIALTENFTVEYVETREKPTSIVPANTKFDVRDIAKDISDAIDRLDVKAGNYILLGYSLGATAAAESFNSIIRKKPALLVLIEPSAVFRVPGLGLFVAKYFPRAFHIVKPLVKFYIKNFRIDTSKDYEMYVIIERIIDGADPEKLIPTLICMSRYQIWSALEKIDVPALVIGASHDTFHNLDDAKEIASRIQGAVYADLVTNKRSHSREVCDLLINYLKEKPLR
jgi:pimeloyl-ACP methyl ester carboxylesterase